MKHHKGLTFLEVLVALVVLSTGILGAVAMQASAKKGSFDAMQRSIASAYAQDILERMRSNSSDIITLESYEGTYGGTTALDSVEGCDSEFTVCNNAQMVAKDLYQWEQTLLGADVTLNGKNIGGLLDAIGCIEHNDNAVTIIVSWQARVATKDSADSDFDFENNCGAQTDRRRQVMINAFIY